MNLPTWLREIQRHWLVHRPATGPARRGFFVDGGAVRGDDAAKAR
jgi:hypothetical protein